MRVRLRYKREGAYWSPIINVILGTDGQATPPIEALLDTGATRCSFDVSLARILGLPLQAEQTRELLTASGPAVEHFYTHKVYLNFADNPLPNPVPVEVDFISKIYPKGHPRLVLERTPFGILGHHDFFRNWKVTFNTREREILLESHS